MTAMLTACALGALLAAAPQAAPPAATPPAAPAPASPAPAPASPPSAPASPPATPAVQGAPNAPPAPPPPWWARLGMRALDVEQKLPVLDQVVLVQDDASYIAEIARWTPKARWPVLFEDDAFAPRFIRAFRPATVLRRAPAQPPAPAGDGALKAAIESAIIRAWGGEPSQETPTTALRKIGLVPAGIVAASPADPAWTAALALAAGRGEPIAWIEQPLGGPPSAVMDAATFSALETAVRGAMDATGRSWAALGDELDAFTLCRSAPLKVNLPAPPGGFPPKVPNDGGPLAVTDALCRQTSGARYAIAAQIFGDRVRCASMAMCSLFLRRNDVWMFDGYAGRTGAGFMQYGFDGASPLMLSEGFKTRVFKGSDASVSGWRNLLSGGIAPDVLFLNSSGNSDFFELASGQMTWAVDIPVLQRPLALSMVHSFSLQEAESLASVGGRWLDHGVYAYAGSVHEPFLSAFIPPALLAQRLSMFAPFLVAARHWEGDLLPQAWRVATLGDPLMTIPGPKVLAGMPPRAPAALGADYADVRAAARAALERVKSAGDGPEGDAALAAALHDMALVGDDRVAAQIWGLARRRGPAAAAACASAALGPLFRTVARAEFMEAYPLVKEPTSEQRDMLWHLWATSLNTLRDRAAVALLKANLRGPREDMDAAALLGAVRSVDGREAAAAWLNAVIVQSRNAEAKRRLAELQAKP
ncbi:MAG: hypothetical protein U0625_13035 [Phycisphaerales bacterium]